MKAQKSDVPGRSYKKSAFVLKDVAGLELPPAERKTIDLEGRVVKEGVRKSLKARQIIIEELIHAMWACSIVGPCEPYRWTCGNGSWLPTTMRRAVGKKSRIVTGFHWAWSRSFCSNARAFHSSSC